MIVSAKVDLLIGTDIERAVKESIHMAGLKQIPINFTFNGVDVYVSGNSNSEGVVSAYHKICKVQYKAKGVDYIVGDSFPVIHLPIKVAEDVGYQPKDGKKYTQILLWGRVGVIMNTEV